MKRHLIVFALLLGILLPFSLFGLPDSASAHAMQTNYAFDLFSAELEFTSTFSTGEAVAGAQVKIYAPNNPEAPWIEGVMDETGNFSFLPDTSIAGEWKIYIQKEGHEDIWIVPVHDNRIDFDQISEDLNRDLTYAGIGLASWQVGLIGGGIGLLWWGSRKSRI